jgi:hypothetical protein
MIAFMRKRALRLLPASMSRVENTDVYFTLAHPSPATLPVGFHLNTHYILHTRIDACLFDNGPAVDDSTATSE